MYDAIRTIFKYGKVASAAEATRAHMWPLHVWNTWSVAHTALLNAFVSIHLDFDGA